MRGAGFVRVRTGETGRLTTRHKALPQRRVTPEDRFSGGRRLQLKNGFIPRLIRRREISVDDHIEWESPQEKEALSLWSPLNWISALVFLVFLVAGLSLTPWWTRDRETSAPDSAAVSREEPTATELGMKLESKIDRAHQTIRDFLRAQTVEGKRPFVRHPERVFPLMINWYSSHDHHGWEVTEFEMMATTTINLRPFWVSLVFVDGGPPQTVMLEDTAEGLKVDWEAFVGYSRMSIADFIENRPEVSVDFRVYATPSDYFLGGYDESEFACLKLECRNQSEALYGYVDRTSSFAAEILGATYGQVRKPLQVSLEFPDSGEVDGYAQNAVAIRGLVSMNWIGAE